MQGVEVGDAVHAEHLGLAVDDEPSLSDLPGGDPPAASSSCGKPSCYEKPAVPRALEIP
jgi:hypothetical protein